nr:hypothetical protein [Tanacetum cinerariifolium]
MLAAASPTTEFDPDEDPEDDPEEDPKDDPEENPVDYPDDSGDEGDDEDESSDDDEDDNIDIEEDEEEDEYLAPADSTTVALPAIDHAPSAEETEPFETNESATTPPPHPAYRITARMEIRLRWSAERGEIPEADLLIQKRLCTDHTGPYELRKSSAAAAARLGEPVRDDLYRFVDTVERGEGSTPAAMKRKNEMTRLYKEPESTGYSWIDDTMLALLASWRLTAALGHIQILEAARVPTQPE